MKNIEQIKCDFEKVHKNISYLLFSSSGLVKNLVVIFNGATRDRYSMWSYFYNAEEKWGDTAYLFLKDDQDDTYFWWYLRDREIFVEIIRDTLTQFNISELNTIMIGSSMGGYASLLFGMEFGVKGVISLRPQIDYESAKSFFTIAKLNELWIDLDKLVDSIDDSKMPITYINYSQFPNDVMAAYHWIDKIKRKKTISIIHHNKGVEHVAWNPNKYFIVNMKDFMLSVENTWS